MENTSLKNFGLNIPCSPSGLDFCNFSLLSENESDRLHSEFISNQLNELRAQLEIVNEDRQRLKKENEKLKQEKSSEISKIINNQKQLENEKITNLTQEIAKLRKECEEKDKLLNTMRSLLGNNELVMKENIENKPRKQSIAGHQSRLPGTRALMKVNRSISPYTKCV